MTAVEIIKRAKAVGAKLTLVEGGHVRLRGTVAAAQAVASLVREHKCEIVALLEAEQVKAAVSDAIRERRYPLPELKVCAFLIGAPGEDCRRCGACWIEHLSLDLAKPPTDAWPGGSDDDRSPAIRPGRRGDDETTEEVVR